MKRSLSKQAAVAAILAGMVQAPSVSATEPGQDLVARGKYVVMVSACHDCHTPWIMGPNGPEPDMSRMLSGHPEGTDLPPAPSATEHWVMRTSATNTAWSGAWGTSFTANLTPDSETGLGRWTLRNFKETIRTGRHMGRGRAILPPMPIPMYRNFSDADLEAIFAYLQSIPAIRNRVPEPLPPNAAAEVAAK
jgi:mono/diheme cytochrome c family protein